MVAAVVELFQANPLVTPYALAAAPIYWPVGFKLLLLEA